MSDYLDVKDNPNLVIPHGMDTNTWARLWDRARVIHRDSHLPHLVDFDDWDALDNRVKATYYNMAVDKKRHNTMTYPEISPEIAAVAAKHRQPSTADFSTKHDKRLHRRLSKTANQIMGRQGDTIARLRGELARVREENSKIERGYLRALERDNEAMSGRVKALGEQLNRYQDALREVRQELQEALAANESSQDLDHADDGSLVDLDSRVASTLNR